MAKTIKQEDTGAAEADTTERWLITAPQDREIELPVRIPIGLIIADPDQYRKNITPAEVQELAASFGKHGILQPITVRPFGDLFKIIFGERRWMAAQVAGFTFIDCFIRDMSDEEVQEAQLIENMHRKDVHYMQEAIAFQNMRNRMDIREMEKRLGRSEKYIGVRLRLNNLTEDFRPLCFGDHLTMSDATKLSKIDPDSQHALYKENEARILQVLKTPGEPFVLYSLDTTLKKSNQSIAAAPFDPEDPTLNPDMGVCSKCPYNTACSDMFADVEGAVCTFSPCYNVKARKSFESAVTNAMQDPTIIFVNPDSYLTKDEEYWMNVAKDLGVQVLPYNMFSKDYNAPEKITWEAYLEEHRDFPEEPGRYSDESGEVPYDEEIHEFGSDVYVSQEDIDIAMGSLRREFDDQKDAYDKKVKKYLKKNPDHVQAFVAAGRERGSMIIVKLKATIASSVQAALPVNVAAQISDMTQRADRALELDQEREWLEVRSLVTGNQTRKEPGAPMEGHPRLVIGLTEGPLSAVELVALINTIYHECSMDMYNHTADEVMALLAMDDTKKMSRHDMETILVDRLKVLTPMYLQQVTEYFLRRFIMSKGFPNSGNYAKIGVQATSYEFARERFPEQVRDIELEYKSKEIRRRSSLDTRITKVKTAVDTSTKEQ